MYMKLETVVTLECPHGICSDFNFKIKIHTKFWIRLHCSTIVVRDVSNACMRAC